MVWYLLVVGIGQDITGMFSHVSMFVVFLGSSAHPFVNYFDFTARLAQEREYSKLTHLWA